MPAEECVGRGMDNSGLHFQDILSDGMTKSKKHNKGNRQEWSIRSLYILINTGMQ